MTIRPHDFTQPPSLHPDTRAKLVQWLTRTNLQLAEVISAESLETSIELNDCVASWPVDELGRWSDKSVAFRIKLENVAPVSMIVMTNSLAQVLVGALLGEAPQGWPEERDLTPSELSVAEFFVTRFLTTLNDTWIGDAPLNLRVVEREPNVRRTKVFRMREPFIVCRSTLRLECGAGQLCWVLPHDYLSELFGSVRKTVVESEAPPRQQLESLARDMTTQVTIRLGGVQLTAPQLAELRVGDLVVLNQKTTEPLKAVLSGQTRFLGWPGRVGNRQAFEIATDGPRRDRATELAPGGEVATSR